MDKELIERLAKEAGFQQGEMPEQLIWRPQRGGFLDVFDLRRFAAAVAEECAREVVAVASADAGNPYPQALRVGAERIRAKFAHGASRMGLRDEGSANRPPKVRTAA